MQPQQPTALVPEAFVHFGDLLRYLRRRAQLTQRELSIAVGYNFAQISRLESGQRLPDPAVVAAVFIPALDLEEQPAWTARLIELAEGAARQAVDKAAAATLNMAQPAETAARQAASTPPPIAPLLTTKLYIPQARRNLVLRPRLLRQLDAALDVPLMLLAAPAGFGKTTLLANWVASRTEGRGPRTESTASSLSPQSSVLGPRLAWLSLDAGDNDPITFLRYFVAACQMLQPTVGTTTLALLQLPQPPPLPVLLTPLLNDLVTLPGPSLLVLDDYHVLTAAPIHDALQFMLDHLPPRLHLLLASRSDPPLSLARLRARRNVIELRAEDLRFTPDESLAFLSETMEIRVTAEEARVLEARTEGWIAGLQLAALALDQRNDRAHFLRFFSGGNRYVADYLVNEVLAHLADHLRAFVLHTSILDRMCAPLCDLVMGFGAKDGDDPHLSSRRILDELERRNLFLMPLDGERYWYRYHHLFAEMLRVELQASASPAQIAALHQQAARWFEQAGHLEVAIGHLLAAGTPDQAAALVERQAAGLIERGDLLPLLRWYDLLPAEVICTRPALALAGAMLAIARGELGKVEALVGAAETTLIGEHRAESISAAANTRWLGRLPETATLVRASLARAQGDATQALELARAALDEQTEPDAFLREWRQWEIGVTQLLMGDLDAARATLTHLVETVDPAFPGLLAQAASSLALLAIRSGRLREAARTFTRGLERLASADGAAGRSHGLLHAGLAALFLEWNDLSSAELHVNAAIALGREPPNALLIGVGHTLLARLRHARGERLAADALAQASAVLPALQAPFFIDMLLRHGYARAALALGDALAVRLWATELPTAAWPASDAWELARARLLLHQGQPGAVPPVLTTLIEQSLAGGWLGAAIEGLVLLARAQATLGAMSDALVSLERALALSKSEGYVRTLVDEGATIAALLRVLARSGHAGSSSAHYAADLLAAFPEAQHTGTHASSSQPTVPPQADSLIEALTAREREVLRLLTAGYANAAIAAALTIEVGTVKRHVHSLLGKLGASSRAQAIARAHDLGLI